MTVRLNDLPTTGARKMAPTRGSAAAKAGGAEVINPDDWKAGLWFALKTLNTKKVRRATLPEQVLLVCLQHNLRKGNEGHRHRRPIDPTRTKLNSVLWGSQEPSVCAELASNILDELGIAPVRIDQIMGVELVFQPPPGWDMPEFYDACLQWASGRYEYIVSAVVHRDQVRPHMHVLVLAVRDGRLDGAAMTSKDNRLQAQRSDFMAHMCGTLGLHPARQNARSATTDFTSADKEPKTHAAAAGSDAVMLAGADVQPSNPKSPTSYYAHDSAVRRLRDAGPSAGHFPRIPARPVTPAPWPPAPSAPERRRPMLKLVSTAPASVFQAAASTPWSVAGKGSTPTGAGFATTVTVCPLPKRRMVLALAGDLVPPGPVRPAFGLADGNGSSGRGDQPGMS